MSLSTIFHKFYYTWWEICLGENPAGEFLAEVAYNRKWNIKGYF